MELDRRAIEKQDFSQARRGYDPGEVNRHLTAIAEAVERLRQAQTQQPSLAGATAARVEAIVAAAEASAREIEEKAQAEAQTLREQAQREAAERVSGAQETVAGLFERAQELQREVEDFVGRISGLKSAVDALRSDVDAAAPVTGSAAPASEGLDLDAGMPAEPEVQLDRLELDDAGAVAEPEPAAAVPELPEADEAVAAPAERARDSGGDQGRASEGARLIALNMALSGTPREETARYLRENFDLDDQDELLDEVYARAGS